MAIKIQDKVNGCSAHSIWLACLSHHQRVDRPLQYVCGRQLVDQLGASGAAGVGVDQRARDRLRRPAFVPQQHRQAHVGDVAGEGAGRLAARAFAAVQVQRQADDDAGDILLLEECDQRRLVGGELGAADGLRGGRDAPAGVAQGDADRLGADIQARQPAALRQPGGEGRPVGPYGWFFRYVASLSPASRRIFAQNSP